MKTPRGMKCNGLHAVDISDTGLAVLLGILAAFAPFSIDMYLAAFPAMAEDFGTDTGGIQFTLSFFFLGMGLGQIFYGPLIDRLGRRRPLLYGLVLFTATSCLMVFVQNFPFFVILRFLQAVGGCAGMVIGRAVIQDLYALQDAARMLSLLMMVQSVGPVAAPVIGGYLLGIAGWRMIFAVLCGLGLTCFLVVFFRLPETLAPETPSAAQGVPHMRRQILGIFLSICRNRQFLAPALTGGLGGATTFAFISGSPFVLMSLYGLNGVQYSWVFALCALGMVGAGRLNQVMLGRFQPGSLLCAALAGSLLCGLGLFLSLLMADGLPPLPLLLLPLFFILAAGPILFANSTALAMAASGQHAGSASALLGALQFGCAGAVSAGTSLLHNGTAYPLGGMLLACCIAASAIFFLARHTDAGGLKKI
ncbi:MAG: multidrug effflux MFS transporter [Desulfovibrio sp.]|nr:multidrug effflux MFS transporter [Desulfovibrio sp.]